MSTRRHIIQSAGQLACATTLGAMLAIPPLAQAQTSAAWPTKAVRLIVPYPAGGVVDSVTRMLAERLAVVLGQGHRLVHGQGLGQRTRQFWWIQQRGGVVAAHATPQRMRVEGAQ